MSGGAEGPLLRPQGRLPFPPLLRPQGRLRTQGRPFPPLPRPSSAPRAPPPLPGPIGVAHELEAPMVMVTVVARQALALRALALAIGCCNCPPSPRALTR